MKLYYAPLSPYARAVIATARELRTEDRIDFYRTHPFDNDPELIQCNPLAKVPAMLLDDGTKLYDSEIICQYLDSTYGNGRLFSPLQNDWSQRVFYALCSGIMDASVGLRVEKIRKEKNLHFDLMWQRCTAAIVRGLTEAETFLERMPGQFSANHISLYFACQHVTLRHQEITWPAECPRLFAWYQETGKLAPFAD